MRLFRNTTLAAALCAALLTSCRQEPTVVTDSLRHCEGVCVIGDTVLISNFGGNTLSPLDPTATAGYIMQMVDGVVSEYYKADGTMAAPKGMAVAGAHLYVADVSRVHVINRSSGKKYIIPLPIEDSYANHPAVVGDMLLLSVTNNGHILALDLRADGGPGMAGFQLLTTIPGANGLCYDGTRLFIASYGEGDDLSAQGAIYVIDDFANPQPRPFIERRGHYDGLALSDGYLYFTDWGTKGQTAAAVGRIRIDDPSDIEMLTITTPIITGPAQLAISNGKIYLPDLIQSQLIILNE